MRVGIVGSGYVGTTVAAGLAECGHEITNVDIDEAVVDTITAGETPIHEPGLEDLVASHAGDRLRATTDYREIADAEVVLLCLPTPTGADGRPDLAALEAATRSLGDAIAADGDRPVVAVKSTVLPGTTEGVVGEILEEMAGQDAFTLAMNPEFLRMSTAVEDFFEPDKVVIGVEESAAGDRLETLYEPILTGEDTDLVRTTIRDAELIKYANNAFLAAKLSLVNELGNVAKEYEADAYEVLEAVGLDDRIAARFMRSGLGWGGSCFPKDVDALRTAARDVGYDPALLDATVAVNDRQPRRLVALLEEHVDLEGASIAVLGLAFKPHTDDIRGSRALDVIDHLLERGAQVVAYDPVAMDRVREHYPDIGYAASGEDALEGADGAVIATEWPAFADLSFSGMAKRVLVDGRRVDVDRDALEVYEGLTW